MGTSTMLGRSASVAQKSASPCMQLLNTSIQQQNVQPARGMANLKAIAIRLKSVKNIQKITQSMKMVSAAKYSRAERDLKAARPYGEGAQSFYSCAEVGAGEEEKKDTPKKELYVALTSDRGLCGAVHSSICKSIRNELLEKPSLENVGLSVSEINREPNWEGCFPNKFFAWVPKLVVYHHNSVMLQRLPLISRTVVLNSIQAKCYTTSSNRLFHTKLQNYPFIQMLPSKCRQIEFVRFY